MLLSANQKILDLENNGRVVIVQPPGSEVLFKMTEKISLKNKATEYRNPLAGDLECSILSQVFFSQENIQIIQNGLRAGVYEMSQQRYRIPNQNIDNLKIIMRSMYLQFAEHKPDDITAQVEALNKLVLDYCVPQVYNEAVGYEKYTRDQSTLVVPLELPQYHDRQYKQLELKNRF